MDQQPGRHAVSPGLRRASEYALRLLILGVAVYAVFRIALLFEVVFIALFIALILSSLLRPPVNALDRHMPRVLALALTALGSLAVLSGVAWLVEYSVANETSDLGQEFRGGIDQIKRWLQGPPFHVKASTLSNLQSKIGNYVSAHRSSLLSQAINEASRLIDVITVIALAVFCAIFFTHSGAQIWRWFLNQLPTHLRDLWDRCGQSAWHTFAGYTRGIILVAAANAVMVGVSLKLLRVPLVLPLTVLEFLASFVPLVGSPIAMAVATIVALASRGLTTALVVVALIVVFGQIEGHVLQPFVMGWAVRLHPVAVAVCVIAGTIVAGLLGAVVAVPLVSIAWAVIRVVRQNNSPPNGQRGGDGNGDEDVGPGPGSIEGIPPGRSPEPSTGET
ncbi:AI-2E family transporter [Actinospica durhamensis]|uniref:AI-2E family transporter n=1 Tax=Actinospica durhamensis TaxID=1508375 RepID=A0A941EY97_9ACTN|nr:AI-2E family transporter [Actinospica durhamensis]MBR7838582.1 AI-2E family transporter [Actinospica durhamensis]